MVYKKYIGMAKSTKARCHSEAIFSLGHTCILIIALHCYLLAACTASVEWRRWRAKWHGMAWSMHPHRREQSVKNDGLHDLL